MKITTRIFKNRIQFFFALIIFFGVFSRLYNLSWGSPFFFHPDERNIASSVTKLSYPEQMNPEFFAYGTLPIYTIYFLGVFKNIILYPFTQANSDIYSVAFEDAIPTGRVISSALSIFLLFLIYKITRKISTIKSAVIATCLSSLSIGFVQYAHFMTFEMWLTFFLTLLLYLTLEYLNTRQKKQIILISITLGILVSIKISSLIFAPIILTILLIYEIKDLINDKKFNILNFEKLLLRLYGIILIGFLVVFLTSPYFWLDKESFLSSIKYETEVATGIMPVFYTQSFIDTSPVVYQLSKVYPFILNPFILISFLVILPFICIRLLKKRERNSILVLIFFTITFFSQAFLFVKWTRYYIPSLPFIYILLGIYISDVKLIKEKILNIITVFLILISSIYTFSFIKTVYFDNTSHVMASEWANRNLQIKNSRILSEVYDMGIVSFSKFTNITLFNFYDLEQDPLKSPELENLIEESEYIILPSQRIFKDRLKNKNKYPLGHIFYRDLFNESLGFRIIYTTPCDIFCRIVYANDPVFSYEGTANVFDRPTITIFKKK